jgi:hypothetical protein
MPNDAFQKQLAMVHALAAGLRAAIAALPVADRPYGLAGFPVGSCGDACLLLGALFADAGIEGFLYVCGERGTQIDRTWTSHAWLQRGDLIVDITADQFADAPRGIIVEEHSAWHAQFECEEPVDSDFRHWTGIGTYHLYGLYARVAKPLLASNCADGSSRDAH